MYLPLAASSDIEDSIVITQKAIRSFVERGVVVNPISGLYQSSTMKVKKHRDKIIRICGIRADIFFNSFMNYPPVHK